MQERDLWRVTSARCWHRRLLTRLSLRRTADSYLWTRHPEKILKHGSMTLKHPTAPQRLRQATFQDKRSGSRLSALPLLWPAQTTWWALLWASGAWGRQPAPSPAGRIEGVPTDAGLAPWGLQGNLWWRLPGRGGSRIMRPVNYTILYLTKKENKITNTQNQVWKWLFV